MAVPENLLADRACVNDTAKPIVCAIDTDDASSCAKPSTVMVYGQLKQCDNELHSPREVQACAGLGEELGTNDGEVGDSLAHLQAELDGLRNAIEAVQTVECRSIMLAEDQLAMGDRQLRAREQEINLLEKRLHLLTHSYSQLSHDGTVDTAVETWRTTDKELSELQDGVMFREEKIANISADLKRTLDYMINANIDAAGGPCKGLGPDDFLPSHVQAHLNLGEHGQAHLAILLRKYDFQMNGSNDSRATSQRGVTADTDTLNEMGQTSSLKVSQSRTLEDKASRDGVTRHRSDIIKPSPKRLSRDALGNSVNSFALRQSLIGPERMQSLVPLRRIQGNGDDARTGDIVEEPTLVPEGSPTRSEKSTIAASDMEETLERRSVGESHRPIFAIGARPEEQPNLLDMTISWLSVPSRDATGFENNEKGNALARRSVAEVNGGVYSEWVCNFTHAGLQNSVMVGLPTVDPASTQENRQALVLTVERLLLFQAATWNLMQVIDLSDIWQLLVSSYSDTILVMRVHRVADILLDISARGQFLNEIKLATTRIASQWGTSADFLGALQVRNEAGPLIPLMNERKICAGSVAFLEQDVFLLLPYLEDSILLGPPATFCFGFLDIILIHRPHAPLPAVPVIRRRQTHLFVLKNGLHSRQLHWCRNPSDTRSVGCIDVDKIREIRPVETHQDDGFHMCLDYESPAGAEAMTLRAQSRSSREVWMTSIQTMQTWL